MPSNIPPPVDTGNSGLALLIIFGLLILTAIVVFFVVRGRLRLRTNAKRFLNSVFLEIQVPKDIAEKDSMREPQKEEKDIISVAEQLFASLAGKESHAVRDFLNAGEHIAFEIVNVDKKISFYINCPRHLQEVLERQIHAQYPKASIEKVKFYNIFKPDTVTAAAEFSLSKKYYYPIRTYKSLESDPLASIANSLSKLTENESGALQLIIAPASRGWRSEANQVALKIQQGKTPATVERGLSSRVLHEVGSAMTSRAKHAADQRRDLTGEHSPINLTPMQQEIVKKLEEKASKAGFGVNLRVLIASASKAQAEAHLRNILSSLMQFAQPPFNSFKVKSTESKRIVTDFVYRVFREPGRSFLLNTEELASLWHLPTKFTETPNIKWLSAKRAPAPVNTPTAGLTIGINIYRGVKTPVHIQTKDRMRHMYIIGRTGTGKSEFMKNLIIQDIKAGEGVAVVDPHGELVEGVLEHVPEARAEDVVYFNPADTERPLGLNMLDVKRIEMMDFAVQEMISIFYKLVSDPAMIGPMFEHNMRNVMLTLMADRQSPGTIAEIPRMFTDAEFQKYKVSKVIDPVVRNFWEKEMAKTSDFHKSEMLGYLISKVGRFVENQMIRNIIGQTHNAFDFREIMDDGKILLVNLSKGLTGEINSKLLGLILVAKLQMAALSRADMSESKRRPFYLYVDEFQNFVTDSFATILSEARKYQLGLTIAHQYLGQLVQAAGVQGAGSNDLKSAVFGNVGTLLCFRIGVEDAEVMTKEFDPVFNEFDVINIERYNAYVKLMIDGTASRPFNMGTLSPAAGGSADRAVAIKELSRMKYGRPRAEVEAEILERSRLAEQSVTAGIESSR